MKSNSVPRCRVGENLRVLISSMWKINQSGHNIIFLLAKSRRWQPINIMTMECFLSEFTICMVKTANNRPKIRKMSQIKVKSKKSKKYRQVRARNEISVQYYSFFQEVGTLLQSFRLEELPEQVYSTHRIKLISDESSWQFKKLLGETLSYV